jgi:hypothetical protein
MNARERRQAEYEASIVPGMCRICKYQNKASESRCYQCVNVM